MCWKISLSNNYGLWNSFEDSHAEKNGSRLAQEIYSLSSQIAELPFADLKHNIKFNEFTKTELERCDTELKLIATGYNLKRI